jgi:protein-L-isoaspartate(D-aspartate) O-methyltransferase
MVDTQLRTYDVTDYAVLHAFDKVPRECFVPEAYIPLAYSDHVIPLYPENECRLPERVMLSPMVLARLLQALAIIPGQHVLDIGCGLGYTTALLASLGAYVVGVESNHALAAQARDRMNAFCEAQGLPKASYQIVENPLSELAPGLERYDKVIINGAFSRFPNHFMHHCGDLGRLTGIENLSGTGFGVLYLRQDHQVVRHILFNASAPVIPELSDF